VSLVRILGWCCVGWGIGNASLLAQVPQPAPKSASGEATAAGRAVVIERAPVLFRDPQKYQVNLHLEPVKRVALSATVDGVVATILMQVGQEVTPQAEVVRLDAREAALRVQRAAAALKAAKADVVAAGNADAKAAAEADVEVADIDLKLAELDQSHLVIRSPLKGIVTKVLAVEGEYIRAGQPLVEVIDPSQFLAEIPVDSRTSKAGDAIDLKVEDEAVPAKLSAVLPLSPQFDGLRDLFPSPATGRILLDNASGKWRAGMTVYSPMIPRNPVAEVPSIAILNSDQGGRKVQVIREGFVRDVPVQALGQIGTDHIFVSGRFGATDELIQKTSETLLDGARITSREGAAKSGPGGAAAPVAPKPTGGAF
jgi:multidrug efflux pump subunit AcrA (membrane-fusion protein)